MVEIPYGDPQGMRALAHRLGPLADQVATEAATIWRAIGAITFEAPVAHWYHDRAAERVRRAEQHGQALRELAAYLRREASALEHAQGEARRRNQETADRMRQESERSRREADQRRSNTRRR